MAFRSRASTPAPLIRRADWALHANFGAVRHLSATRDLGDYIGAEQPLIIRPGEYAQPVEEPKLNSTAVAKAQEFDSADTKLYGATGTPIISGFVTELGEYNPELRGRGAISIYEKMRRSDADVGAILAALKLPIRSADYAVVPGVEENEPEYKLAKEIADDVKDNIFGGLELVTSTGQRVSQRWETVIENALLCLDFGCSGYEDIWVVDGDKVRLSKLAPRLPHTFYRFHVDEDGESLRAVEQWGYRGGTYVNVVVPADKFVLFSKQQEGSNFYGISALRTAYQHWYVKNGLYRIDSIACERNGAGIPVVTLGPNASLEDKIAANNWVNNLATHEQTSMILPNGYTFELSSVRGRPKDLMPSIKHHSEMISRSALAMFMTLGSSATGSRALGNTMLDFFQLAEEAYAKFICETITETTIRRYVDFNFKRGNKPLPYPKLVTANIAVLNPLDMFSTLKDLATMNVDLLEPDDETEAYIRKKLGIPQKGKKARVRYAPVTQKIQETGSTPEEVEEGDTQRQEEKDSAAAVPAKKAPVPPAEGTPTAAPNKVAVVPTEKVKPQATAKPGEKITAPVDTQQQVQKQPLTEHKVNRQLRPYEQKHNFIGHAERADSTSTAVRRILGGVKPALIKEAARRASELTPTTLNNLVLPFDHSLASRLAKSAGIAFEFGYKQAYAERYRATGRSTTEKVGLVEGSVNRKRLELLTRRLHNRLLWHGLEISIENEKGTIREGVGKDGVPWQTLMQYPYGYLRVKHQSRPEDSKGTPSTLANDGEHIDCYVGKDETAKEVYIVHQNQLDSGEYDEDKCLLNFPSESAAKLAYMGHHSHSEKVFGSIETMSVDEFINELKSNDGKLHFKPDTLLAGGPGSGPRPGAERIKAIFSRPASYYTPMRPAGLDTKEKFSDGHEHYTEERQELHEAIMDKYLKGVTPVEHPQAMIIGGGMASGKSTLVASEGLDKGNTVAVNVDEIRRDLPELKEATAEAKSFSSTKGISVATTHEEASDIARVLMQRAVAGKMNMTLDGTGDTTLDKLGGKVAEMRAEGHTIRAEYVTVPVEMAIGRAHDRAMRTDRREVPETAMREAHAAVSRIFPEAIRQGLFDTARLHDTSGSSGSRPVLIASAVGKTLVIHDQERWNDFIAKGQAK